MSFCQIPYNPNGATMAVCARLPLTQQWPLISIQDLDLGLVDCLPVILEDATGIPRVGVPRPIGIADVVRFQKGYQAALPNSPNILAHRAAAKLPQQHWGSTFQLQVGPVLLPDPRQVMGEVRALEPGLHVDLRSVVMRRIHQFVWLR